MDIGRYDDLVHGIYDAALHPERWPTVVQEIAGVFDAPRALMWTYFNKPANGGFSFSYNIWAAHGAEFDPWVSAAGAQGRLVEGVVSLDHELVSEEELLRTDFYRDVLEPMDIAKVCSGIVFDTTDSFKLPTAISIYRSLRDPAFSKEDAEVFGRLLVHLSRALGLMYNLRDREFRLAASLSALDRLASGVVLLDSHKRMAFGNKSALELLQRGDPIQLCSAQHSSTPLQLALHGRLRSFEGRFQMAIDAVLRGVASDAGEHFTQALVLPTDRGQPACVIHVAPLPNTHDFGGGVPSRAIVFIYDVRAAASVAPEQLSSLFGLTPAEARAAIAVSRGGSMEEIAQRLSVSPNTLKTHLKAAYAKTGTHRQAELLKLLLALGSKE
jgi:DNA-binding CsgD family transcriptional regulator